MGHYTLKPLTISQVNSESLHSSEALFCRLWLTQSQFSKVRNRVRVCNVSGGWQDETWPDGWTAVTRDGKRSAQFEHTLLVTETGCEILTRRLEDNGRAHFLSQM